MPTNHTVQLGDCMASLASRYGFGDYVAIYDDGANSDLKRRRPNPNVLADGDVVSIPDVQVKSVDAATNAEHKFEVKVPSTLLRILVLDDAGNGLGSKKYKLTVGTKVLEGTTTADGQIEHPIAADAKAGTLELWLKEGDGIEGYRFPLEIGSLEHEEKDRACQARLMNLGFDCRSLGGALDDPTKDALRAFKKKNGLADDPALDQAARDKLRTVHEGA